MKYIKMIIFEVLYIVISTKFAKCFKVEDKKQIVINNNICHLLTATVHVLYQVFVYGTQFSNHTYLGGWYCCHAHFIDGKTEAR